MNSTIREKLKEMQQEEQDLVFQTFDAEMALKLGLHLVNEAKLRSKAVTLDITVKGHRLFLYAMEGTHPDNEDWIRRKNNVVNHFSSSSWHTALRLKSEEQTLEHDFDLPSSDYVLAGGAFPLMVEGKGQVGTITVSGLPDEEDHELVTSGIRSFLLQQG
ncbi:heme-degrading domain-containing protein [Paenibacillus pabuli]|uniref:heme-degrading domain-containing protein n=1 Tax=Paenibacillus pabuli TaxID=1472 RepID=UPI0009EB89FE|nr:heme-degrading domain-containing protein [Paenibacillus pabuli]MEC0126414.1 heme-degrading domain-containing protein [Paenibacillus pabuli]